MSADTALHAAATSGHAGAVAGGARRSGGDGRQGSAAAPGRPVRPPLRRAGAAGGGGGRLAHKRQPPDRAGCRSEVWQARVRGVQSGRRATRRGGCAARGSGWRSRRPCCRLRWRRLGSASCRTTCCPPSARRRRRSGRPRCALRCAPPSLREQQHVFFAKQRAAAGVTASVSRALAHRGLLHDHCCRRAAQEVMDLLSTAFFKQEAGQSVNRVLCFSSS